MFFSVTCCLVSLLQFAIATYVPYHGYEQPDWKEVGHQPTDKTFEIRHYPAANWTTTTLDADCNDALKPGFMRLFEYIQGSNADGRTIAMTVPVTTHFTLGTTLFDADFTMSFYLPQSMNDEAPAPTNSLVRIEHREAMTVYVRTFSGFASRGDWWKHLYLLRTDLLRNGVGDDSIVTTSYMTAGYDSPMRLFGRRNEVWIISKK